MAYYKEIKGRTIQSIASDLDNAEGQGQIWFNTTSGDFKTIVKVAGTWATGNAMNTARKMGGCMGTSTAALYAGGKHPAKSEVESWDGSSWTEVANQASARTGGAGSPAGTTSLALGAGGNTGSDSNATEEWTHALAASNWDTT